MSLLTTLNRVPYTGDGVQTTFAYPFKVYVSTDLQVYIGTTLQTSGYTVTNVGVDGGGNVVFGVAPANLSAILIVRVEPSTQATVLPTSGPFPAKSVETMADKLTMLIQQLQEVDSRSLKLAITSVFQNLAVPDPSTGKFLRWKDLTALENADVTGQGAIGLPVSTANGGSGGSYASRAALILGIGAAQWVQGADIAAAATITLPNPLDGNLIKITGSTGISALSTAGIAAGTRIQFWFTGTPVLTHGANFYLQGQASYTVVANDVLEFIYLGASKWQELRRVNAAAAAGKFLSDDGTFRVPIRETGGPTDLTLGAVADGQVLKRSGTTIVGLTSPFTSEFVSSDQTVTAGSTLNVAHGLGAKPKLWQLALKCATAEGNYNVGDEVNISGAALHPSNFPPDPLIAVDATNATIITHASLPLILNKTTQVAFGITAANWKYVVRAWK